jgi:hypothetical protein
MIAELRDLMIHTVTVESVATVDIWGNPATTGTAVSYRCYIEPSRGQEIIVGMDGQTRRATWRIYVDTTNVIDPKSRITLPVNYNPRVYQFPAVQPYADEQGASHTVLLV